MKTISQITYKQSAFSFREIGDLKKTIKGEKFVKKGETGSHNTPLFQNTRTNKIYSGEELVFVNSSMPQFYKTAEAIKVFEIEADKHTSCKIAIQRIDKNQVIEKAAFNQYVLPFLTQFDVRKADYFERFIFIVEKFTTGEAWDKNQKPPYAKKAYQKWESDGSLTKLLHNAHIIEHYLKCRVFNQNAEKNAKEITALLGELKDKLHTIDEAAFENENYFWPSTLFGNYFDLGVMFPTLENNPLNDLSLMDFTIRPENKKTTPVEIQKEEEDDLPF